MSDSIELYGVFFCSNNKVSVCRWTVPLLNGTPQLLKAYKAHQASNILQVVVHKEVPLIASIGADGELLIWNIQRVPPLATRIQSVHADHLAWAPNRCSDEIFDVHAYVRARPLARFLEVVS